MGHLKDGFAGTCTISGTGAYTAVLPVAGFTPFSAMANGTVVTCAVRSAVGWGETGKFTKSNGTSPTLTRTEIQRQIDQTQTPVDWPPGTQVTIYSTVSAEDIVMRSGENDMLARINMQGQRLTLTPDKASYLVADEDGVVNLYHNSSNTLTLEEDGSGIKRLVLRDSSAGSVAGPTLSLKRLNPSPGVNNSIASIPFIGRDSTGAESTYVDLVGRIINHVNGQESGGLDVVVPYAGAQTDIMRIRGNSVHVLPTSSASSHLFAIGKTGGTGTFNSTGLVSFGTGLTWVTGTGAAPFLINRINVANGETADLLGFFVNGGLAATITVLNGVLTYNTFLGCHLSAWHGSVEDGAEFEELGTVVCVADGHVPGHANRLPLIRPSRKSGDTRVYGAIFGPAGKLLGEGAFGEGSEQGLSVQGVGAGLIKVVGAVKAGDFLETSDTPGCARSQWNPFENSPYSNQQFHTNATVAKATQDSADDGTVRLISCTFQAG